MNAPTHDHPVQVSSCCGGKRGGMRDPFVFTHEGQETKLCCKMRKPKFDKDPASCLKKLADTN